MQDTHSVCALRASIALSEAKTHEHIQNVILAFQKGSAEHSFNRNVMYQTAQTLMALNLGQASQHHMAIQLAIFKIRHRAVEEIVHAQVEVVDGHICRTRWPELNERPTS